MDTLLKWFLFTYVMLRNRSALSVNFVFVEPSSYQEVSLGSTSYLKCQHFESSNSTSISVGKNNTVNFVIKWSRNKSSCLEKILSDNTILISSLISRETSLIASVLERKLYLRISMASPCYLKLTTFNEHETSCNITSSLYGRASAFLLRQIDVTHIVILTTTSICTDTVSDVISQKLRFQGIQVSIQRLDEPLNEVALGKAFLEFVSTKEKSIMPVGFSNFTLLFQKANEFGMLTNEYKWIVLDHDMGHNDKLKPEIMLNLKLRTMPKYEKQISSSRGLITEKLTKALAGASLKSLDIKRDYIKVIQAMHDTSCPTVKDEIVDVFYKHNMSGHWHKVFIIDNQGNIKLHHIEDLGLDSLFAYKKPRLKVVTVNDPPFASPFGYLKSDHGSSCDYGIPCLVPNKGQNGTVWTKSCCSGYCIDLLILLQEEMNVEVDLYFVEDGYYGGFVNGAWNGMIGDVQRGKADMAVAGLTITKERLNVVEFTEPFLNIEVGILTYATDVSLFYINFSFLQSLSDSLQFAVLVMSLIFGFSLYAAENHFLQNRLTMAEQYSWKESFSYAAGIAFQRDLGGKNPRHYGARVIAIFSAFAMTIIMTSFTAILTASSISTDGNAIISGIRDPKLTNPTTNFKFTFLKSGSTEMFFKSSPDPDFRRMYNFMKNYAPDSTAEGVAQVESGKLQGFFNDYPTLHYYISRQRRCKLKIVEDPLLKRGYGIALPKDSIHTFRLSSIIRRVRSSQRVKRMYKKWFPKTCLDHAKSSSLLPESKPIEYSGGLQFTLVLAVVISIGILGLEHLYYRKCKGRISCVR